MKISEQWLREWVNPALSISEIGKKLTLSGCEVEGETSVARAFTDVVVGEIIALQRHPDADKLNICRVTTGVGEPLQIVCGAPNARVGLKAPLAQMGAVLPMSEGAPLKIKKGKLRGIESFGMLCSAAELGISDKSDGLLELAPDAPIGANLRDYLMLDDQILELNVTANRGDWLSVAGVAREVGVLTHQALTPPLIHEHIPQHDDVLAVNSLVAEVCPRYAGRIIRQVNTQAATPLWMSEKLRRLGVRSVSPVVDVTNYVLLELGQPLHAFDLAKLEGSIQVRYARDGETLVLLDGQTLTLRSDTAVIADAHQAVALAGIMGGLDSAVTAATQDIFLEGAHFRPASMMGKARSYGLQTDASYRFERGVAADLPRQALERATTLILEICGGEVGPIVDVCVDPALLTRPTVTLRRARINRLLGIDIADADITTILQRLGCQVSAMDAGWQVQPPHSRFDISIEEDLIEEVARVYGYEHIPAQMGATQLKVALPRETENKLSDFRAPLIANGYQEAVTYSFVDPAMEAMLAPGIEPIALANPISAELSVMRSTIWSGLLRALQHNVNRQQYRVRLFEMGPVFEKRAGTIVQHQKVAGVITGTLYPEQWGTAARKVDFYDVKGDVEALLARATGQTFHFLPVVHSALHPGQSAQIATQQAVVGWLGALHPTLEATLGLGQEAFVFELDIAALNQRALPSYQAVTKFPAIRRDLALVVDKSVLAVSLDQAISKAAPAQLVHWNIFDVYTGSGVAVHQKSVAVSLILQDFSRTLEDNEVNRAIEIIVASLHERTGATLR